MRNPLRKRKQGKSKGEKGYGEGKVTIDFGDDVLLDEEAMVEQLLNLARLQGGRLQLQPRAAELAEMVPSMSTTATGRERGTTNNRPVAGTPTTPVSLA